MAMYMKNIYHLMECEKSLMVLIIEKYFSFIRKFEE